MNQCDIYDFSDFSVCFLFACNIIHSVLQALYHVLGVVPAYQGSIGPALNELCLGLQPEEVAPV
jgi:hypothetical protein